MNQKKDLKMSSNSLKYDQRNRRTFDQNRVKDEIKKDCDFSDEKIFERLDSLSASTSQQDINYNQLDTSFNVNELCKIKEKETCSNKLFEYNKQEFQQEELWNLTLQFFNAIENNNTTTIINISILNEINFWELKDEEGNTGLIQSCNLDLFEATRVQLEIAKNKFKTMNDLKAWVNIKADNGFTALHYAAFRGNIKVIKLLISYGADLNIKNDNGLNVMHLASQGNQTSAIVYFFEYHGFQLDCTDYANSTPLHWASYSGSCEAFDYLISQGVDLNAIDKDGSTPLHLAAISEKKKIISKLIKLNCDWRKLDFNERSAYDICKSKGDDDLVELIVSKTGIGRFCEPTKESNYSFVLLFILLFCLIEFYFDFVFLPNSKHFI